MSIAANAYRDGEIPERSAPTPDEMAALNDRLRNIQDYLVPASREAIAANVAKLFIGLSKRSEGSEDETERLLVYVEVLGDIPEFAIAKGCADFLYGRKGDRKWLPSAAELRPVCFDHLAPWLAEKERIEAILKADIIQSNEYGRRAKNLAHVQETLRILRGGNPEDAGPNDGLTPQQRAEKWLENAKANPPSAPLVSGSLQKYIAKRVSDIPQQGAA